VVARVTVVSWLFVAAAGSLIAVVIADLYSDVPRLGVWLARRAVSLLPKAEADFYGFVAEAIEARDQAYRGERSRLSTIAISVGMVTTGLRRRAGARRERRQVGFFWPAYGYPTVKVMVPTAPGVGYATEGVWADHIDGDLYQLENHLMFSEWACCGDTIRAERTTDDDGYTSLMFQGVVTETDEEPVTLFSGWRIAAKYRQRRLHRRLYEYGMFVEWLSPRFGRSTLPADDAVRDQVLKLLDRRRVFVEETERVPFDPTVACA
jgi:hypothetical protein